jgi:hypothetical protein
MTDKSSEELERDAERVRAQISDTADQLRERMSPGQLMDEALNQFKGGDGSELLTNLKNQARDNPMALALIGTGVAWLMMGSGASSDRRGSYGYAEDDEYRAGGERRFGSAGSGAYMGASGMDPYASERNLGSAAAGDPSYAAGGGRSYEGSAAYSSAANPTYGAEDRPFSEGNPSYASEAGSSAPGVRTYAETGSGGRNEGGSSDSLMSRASDAAGALKDTVSETVQSTTDRMSSAAQHAGERAQHAFERMRGAGSEAFGGAQHAAYDVGHQARRTFLDVLEREPLVIGALGVAVGAAIGALLPASELERQNLGPAGAALREKADEVVRAGMDTAKRAAGEIYETARDAADEQGLVPGDTPVADKVAAVIKATGEKAEEIAHREASSLAESSSSESSKDTQSSQASAQTSQAQLSQGLASKDDSPKGQTQGQTPPTSPRT